MVVDSLEELGYFRFADADKLPALQEMVGSMYAEYGTIGTVNADDAPYEPYCRRLYHCDNEELFEIGGVEDMVKEVKPTFDKLDIPLECSDDFGRKTLHCIPSG